MVRAATSHLAALEPERVVEVTVESLLPVEMDPRLAQSLVENLVENAWKFTGKTPSARIDFGTMEANGVRAFFLRDNGAGFDMASASKLFNPFQRLHAARDFPGRASDWRPCSESSAGTAVTSGPRGTSVKARRSTSLLLVAPRRRRRRSWDSPTPPSCRRESARAGMVAPVSRRESPAEVRNRG